LREFTCEAIWPWAFVFGENFDHRIQTNTQKSFAFPYTNNEKSEREIKESIPFTIATIRIK